MVTPQFIMVGLAAMATDSWIPEQSIANTLKAIPFVIFVTLPTLIPLIYSFFVCKKTWGKILMIVSVIVYVVMADLLAPAFGSYNVTSVVYNKIYKMKKIELEENHPNRNSDNKHILHEDYYDWYFNEITGELLETKDIAITSLESGFAMKTEVDYIAELELEQGIILLIIGYNDNGIEFAIEGTNKTYFTTHNLLMNSDSSKITPHNKIELIKDGTFISYNKDFDNGSLFRDLFNPSLNFKCNGEQILSVNFPEDIYDISVVGTIDEYPDLYTQEERDLLDTHRNKNNKLMNPGAWEVQLFAHSPLFDGKIALSEILEYTIE